MEKLVWKRTSSQAKVMGTIISIMGAIVATLYKGPVIVIASAPSTPLQQPLNLSKENLISGRVHSANPNWVIGGVFLTAEYILVPLWYIVQTQIMKEYPAELTVIFFYNLCVSFIAAIVGLATERNASAWRIRPDIALASVVCSGLFGSCLNNTVHTWALRLRGPVFVAIFKPLSIAIAVAMGIMFLGDTLHLGSLIGATVISIGFYGERQKKPWLRTVSMAAAWIHHLPTRPPCFEAINMNKCRNKYHANEYMNARSNSHMENICSRTIGDG